MYLTCSLDIDQADADHYISSISVFSDGLLKGVFWFRRRTLLTFVLGSHSAVVQNLFCLMTQVHQFISLVYSAPKLAGQLWFGILWNHLDHCWLRERGVLFSAQASVGEGRISYAFLFSLFPTSDSLSSSLYSPERNDWKDWKADSNSLHVVTWDLTISH